MKKITVLMAMVALLGSNSAFANSYGKPPCPPASNDFAWAIGLAGLTVIGVVAGLTASMATD
jgi:hypothetical protein